MGNCRHSDVGCLLSSLEMWGLGFLLLLIVVSGAERWLQELVCEHTDVVSKLCRKKPEGIALVLTQR